MTSGKKQEKDPLDEIFLTQEQAKWFNKGKEYALKGLRISDGAERKLERLEFPIFFRVANEEIEPAKRPNMCSEVIEINTWTDIPIDKGLWISWKGDNIDRIFHSNEILQLAEIIKRIQKGEKP